MSQPLRVTSKRVAHRNFRESGVSRLQAARRLLRALMLSASTPSENSIAV